MIGYTIDRIPENFLHNQIVIPEILIVA
jgi:hypothetical protein